MNPEYNHSAKQDTQELPVPYGNTWHELVERLLSEIDKIEKHVLTDPEAMRELAAIRKRIQALLGSPDEKSSTPEEGLTEGEENARQRILIIEDDFESRYFIANVLSEKYDIIEAADGTDGFAKAAALLPDLIISDVVMPGMSGIEVCRKIKTEVATSHIPIVLLTARSEHRLEGFEARADAYMSKPFNPTELTLRVRNLLEMLYHQRKRYAHDIFQTPRQVTTNSTDEKFLHRLISFVEDNIDDPHLDISAMASELNMSASSLYRKIKSITGMSSIDFVINHKMKYAAHLLLTGRHSVKEVAFMVGFSDARYFSTRFKKYFQYTPTEYVECTLRNNGD